MDGNLSIRVAEGLFFAGEWARSFQTASDWSSYAVSFVIGSGIINLFYSPNSVVREIKKIALSVDGLIPLVSFGELCSLMPLSHATSPSFETDSVFILVLYLLH